MISERKCCKVLIKLENKLVSHVSEIETNFKTYFKIDLDTQMPINALNNHCDFLYHIDVITLICCTYLVLLGCLGSDPD